VRGHGTRLCNGAEGVLDVNDVIERDEEQAAASVQIVGVGDEVLVVPDGNGDLTGRGPLSCIQSEHCEALRVKGLVVTMVSLSVSSEESHACECGESAYDGAGDVGVCVQFGDILARLGVEAKAHDHGQVRGVLRRYLKDDTASRKERKRLRAG
jgi:hypothetical protein